MATVDKIIGVSNPAKVLCKNYRDIWSINALEGSPAYWHRLRRAPTTIVPTALWFYDSSFIATDIDGNISGWTCAWESGHNLAQTTAAKRPFAGTTDAEFEKVNGEYMVADFATQLAAADRTWLQCLNIISSAATHEYLFGCYLAGQSMFSLMVRHSSSNLHQFLDPAVIYREFAESTVGSNQYLLWRHKAGTETSALRRNGSQIGPLRDGTQTKITDTAALNGSFNGLFPADAHYRAFGIYTGTSETDELAIEAIAAEIMGL